MHRLLRRRDEGGRGAETPMQARLSTVPRLATIITMLGVLLTLGPSALPRRRAGAEAGSRYTFTMLIRYPMLTRLETPGTWCTGAATTWRQLVNQTTCLRSSGCAWHNCTAIDSACHDRSKDADYGKWEGVPGKTLLVLGFLSGYALGKIPAVYYVSQLRPVAPPPGAVQRRPPPLNTRPGPGIA